MKGENKTKPKQQNQNNRVIYEASANKLRMDYPFLYY